MEIRLQCIITSEPRDRSHVRCILGINKGPCPRRLERPFLFQWQLSPGMAAARLGSNVRVCRIFADMDFPTAGHHSAAALCCRRRREDTWFLNYPYAPADYQSVAQKDLTWVGNFALLTHVNYVSIAALTLCDARRHV